MMELIHMETFSTRQRQTDFILKNLKETNPQCKLNTDKNIDKISTSVVKEILNKKFINGSDMKAIFCMLNTVFLRISSNKNNITIPIVGSNINNWLTKVNKLSVQSVEGYIFSSDILDDNDTKVIIKVPQSPYGSESIVAEYYIGMKAINKLRYILPTFVYTFGAFVCPIFTEKDGVTERKLCTDNNSDLTSYIIYEKIEGETVDKLLQNNKMNFKQWLNIFAQLLLSLEVAQREVGFTHFDLHTDNVMVRNVKNICYNVVVHDKEYHVKSDIFPVIIDFGMATSIIDNKFIGSYEFKDYGMLNYIIPGFDMYKFLVNSYQSAQNTDIESQIRGVFKIISKIDPYKIYEKKNGLETAMNEYCRKATFSMIAKLSPKHLFDLLQKKYPNIIGDTIRIKDRKQKFKVQYTSLPKTYDDIFNYNSENLKKALILTEKCLKIYPSYITTKYNVHVMSKYNEILKSEEFTNKISSINVYIERQKKSVEIDKIILEKVFDNSIPRQKEMDNFWESILKLNFNSGKKQKLKIYEKFKTITSYQEKLQPYLQFYYTIYEIGLDNIYTEWLKKFKESNIFKFYKYNAASNDMALRWCLAMIASIDMYTFDINA